MEIRPIQSGDNKQMARIIRDSLEAVGLDKPGTAYADPQLDDLTSYYQKASKANYFVMVENNKVLGGAGFAGIADGICELQKLYVKQEARARGLGRQLLTKVIEEAKKNCYTAIYLETTEVLSQAVTLYEQFGFTHLKAPLCHQTDHDAMTIWMLKELIE